MVSLETSMLFLASIAGVLVLLGFVPQIIKSYKIKKMDDVSSFLMILSAVGMSLWVLLTCRDPTKNSIEKIPQVNLKQNGVFNRHE